MSVGIRFTLPHDVYPRYGYLQSWTKRLFERFKYHIESNSLDKCVSANLKEIKEAEQCLQTPIVTVFAQERSLILGLAKSLLQSLEPFRNEKLISENVSWNDLVQEGKKDGEYDTKILVVISKETDQDLDIFKKLSTTQQENTFIYNPSKKDHRLLVQKADGLPGNESSSRSLSGDIQSALELKVVRVLEKMENYIEPLIPRKSEEPDMTLIDYITGNLKQLDKSCFVDLLNKQEQKDIKDKSKQQEESYTKSLNSEDMQKLVQYVGNRVKCMLIEYLSRVHGMDTMVTTAFIDSDKFFNFDDKFAAWISKAEINQIQPILKKCETDIEKQLIIDVETFIKQKCELLEIVRRHQFELHGLLHQSEFYEDKVEETKLSPEMQDEVLLNVAGVTGCGTVYGRLTLHVSSELTELSICIIKQILQKYNYHEGYKVQLVTTSKHGRPFCENSGEVAHGICLKSKIVDKTKFKQGTLGCFVEVKKKSSTDQQTEKDKEAKTNKNIENEQVVYSRSQESRDQTNEQDEQMPSCGKFSQPSLKHFGERESELHCITCAHCVTECNNVITTDDDRPFAMRTDFLIEKGSILDIALLKVRNERRKECSTHMMRIKNDKGDVVRYPWRICERSRKGLARRPVYKFGSNLPNYTYGVIASDDYKTLNSILVKEDPGKVMDPDINIIVGSAENIQFSQEGDSGSTICDRVMNECRIEGISILHGDIKEGGTWMFTYSALLKPTIEKLEEAFSIKIELPYNAFQRNIGDIVEEMLEGLTLQQVAVGGETTGITEGTDNMQEESMLQENDGRGGTMDVPEGDVIE